MPKLIQPRPLNEVELLRRDQLNTHVKGYLAVLRQVIDVHLGEPGDVIDVPLDDLPPVNVDSIRRTIYRMASASGLSVKTEPYGVQSLRFAVLTKVEVKEKKVRAPTRPWDRVLSIPELATVKARRMEPDGVERLCRTKTVRDVTSRTGTRKISVYPWAELRDGDYFWAKLEKDNDREIHRYNVTFSRAAARYDIEIQVSRILRNYHGEEQPFLRVTRITDGLAEKKRMLAEATGKPVRISTGGKKKAHSYSRSEERTIRSLTNLGLPKDEAVRVILEARELRKNKPPVQPKDTPTGPALVLGVEALRRASGLTNVPPENSVDGPDLSDGPARGIGGERGEGNTSPKDVKGDSPITEDTRGHRPLEGDGNLPAGGTDSHDRRVLSDGSFQALLAEKASAAEVPVADDPASLRAAFAARRAAAARDLEDEE